jgi:hypothetical protein
VGEQGTEALFVNLHDFAVGSAPLMIPLPPANFALLSHFRRTGAITKGYTLVGAMAEYLRRILALEELFWKR